MRWGYGRRLRHCWVTVNWNGGLVEACHHHVHHVFSAPKKYARGFVVLCFVVVMQSSIMNLHEVFIHIHQGCFAGTGAIVRLPQCQWSKPDGYGKISPCITTTKHSKAKTVCIFLGKYCILPIVFLEMWYESIAKWILHHFSWQILAQTVSNVHIHIFILWQINR